MSVLSQSFLALVRVHFRTFTFFSARHNEYLLNDYNLFSVFFDRFNEVLARFEGRNIVRFDSDGLVLGDIASRLFSSVFHDKTAEASQINILAVHHGLLHGFHKGFDDGLHAILFITSAVGNLIYNFCFSHNYFNLFDL